MIQQFLMEQKIHVERVYGVINYWKAKKSFKFTAVYQIKFNQKKEWLEIVYDALVIQRQLFILNVGINWTWIF